MTKSRRTAIEQSRRAGTVQWLNHLEAQKRKAAASQQAAQQPEPPKPEPPEPSPWGRAVQVWVDGESVGDYDSCQLWLAKEWAQDVAREYPGQIVWVLEDGAVAESYRFDPEDGMEWGAGA